jgi:hypothetical protein
VAIEAAVRKTYTAYWTVVLRADNKVPDPADPRIAQYTTGKVLTHIKGLFATRRQFGNRTYGVPVLHIKSVTLSGGKATVVDCIDTSNFGVLDKNGKKLTVGVQRFPVTANLEERPAGQWKVSETTTVKGAKC